MFRSVINLALGRVPFQWEPEKVREWLKEGSVIFVTLDCDWLDLMVLNYNLKKEGIPEIHWTNGLPGVVTLGLFKGILRGIKLFLWIVTFKKVTPPVKKRQEEWMDAIQNHEPVLLMFPEGERRLPRRGPESEQWLVQLIEFSRTKGHSVKILPFYLFWKRTSVKKRNTIWSIILGSPHSPQPWRKILQLFRVFPHFSFATLESYALGGNMDLHMAEVGLLAKQWRRRCVMDLVAARRVLLGPAERRSSYMLDKLFASQEMEKKFVDLARQQHIDILRLPQIIQKYFKEIAANFNFFMIELTSSFLTWLWYVLYDHIDVDQEQIEALRILNRSGSLILIPCHKSHMDYVLMSDLMFRNGIVPPHVAAGVNLAFWPFGNFARRCGAFFIRRTFKGNHIYHEVLNQYLGALLQDRHNIEFFIEGGRSRTGRMLSPRYGLLKMIINLYQQETLQDAHFVPVFIGYDQIIEGTSYKKELAGEAKEKESGLGLVKSLKYIRRRYGKVYIRFGKTMSVKQAIQEFTPETGKADLVVEKTAFHISRMIQEKSVVTPSSLLAFTGLNAAWGAVHKKQWIDACLEHMKYFASLGSEFDKGLLAEPEKRLTEALEGLVLSQSVKQVKDTKDRFFIPPRRRIDLNLYKNHMTHFSVMDATGIIAERLEEEALRGLGMDRMGALLELRYMLIFEFFVPPHRDWKERAELAPWRKLSPEMIQSISRTYADIIESYLNTMRMISARTAGFFTVDEFIKSMRTNRQKSGLPTTLRFPEGEVVSNIKSCMLWLHKIGALSQEVKKEKANYRLGDELIFKKRLTLLESVMKVI